MPGESRLIFAKKNCLAFLCRLTKVEPATQPLNTTFRVNDALLTSPERVALAANFNNQALLGGAGLPLKATGATHMSFRVVGWVDICLHCLISL